VNRRVQMGVDVREYLQGLFPREDR
jgi:hypothetical protein